MRNIDAVYNALRLHDHGCTALELERATGLVRAEVKNGLLGLRRRRVLLLMGNERERARYRLKPGAQRPADLRGGARHGGNVEPCALERSPLMVIGVEDLFDNGYRAARPPAHRSECGALRSAKQSMSAAQRSSSTCLLAQVWRKR